MIFSVHEEDDFAFRAFRLGAAGYLSKQCASEELINAVKKILDGGKYVPGRLAERMAEMLSGNLQKAPHEALSNRELQILRMVAMGMSLKAISTELALSEKTVGTYRSRISEKIGLSTAIQLTRYAFHHRLVQ